MTGGPQNKKRIIVSPLLETRQSNVYLAGDVLSPAYFETASFDSDPAGFPEVKRRGNVKAAMRDGVFLAEVIAQKLAGKSEIRVDLKFADAPARPAAAAEAEVIPAVAAAPAAAPSAPAVVPPAAPKGDHLLVSILPTGVEANEFSLRPSGATSIGRAGADIVFPDDAALSDRHAIVDAGPDGYRVRPEGGARGLYLLPATDRVVPLEPGMLIHAGRQWFVAGDRHDPVSLIHYEATGQSAKRFALKEGPTMVGRESPDLTVAPTDGALSRRHFVVIRKGDSLALKDLGSANGTLVQIDRPVTLVHGDCLVLGQQKLKFSDERVAERPKATVQFDSGALHSLAHAVTGVVQVPVAPRPAAAAPRSPAPPPARAPRAATPAFAAPAPAPAAPAAAGGQRAFGHVPETRQGRRLSEGQVDLRSGRSLTHQTRRGLPSRRLRHGPREGHQRRRVPQPDERRRKGHARRSVLAQTRRASPGLHGPRQRTRRC